MSGRQGAGRDRIALGIGLILTASLGLSIHDALVKYASASFGVWQILIERSALVALGVAAVALALAGRRHLRHHLWPRALGWTLVRAVSQAAGMITYLIALSVLPLALSAAIFYASPLIMVALSALFFGERVGLWQVAAILVGFAGVVLAIQPQAADFTWLEVIPLLAGTLYALSVVVNRHRLQEESPLCITFFLALSGVVLSALGLLVMRALGPDAASLALVPGLAPSWQPMALLDLGLVLLVAGLYALVMLSYSRAYQIVPVTLSGAIDYAYILFAAAIGIAFFHERPDAMEAVGVALIVVSGCAVVYLSRRSEGEDPSRTV